MRHSEAPLASERDAFLTQLSDDGAAHGTLVCVARELLVVTHELDLIHNQVITPEVIEAAAVRWARKQVRRHHASTEFWSRIRFKQIATDWLRFLGRLCIQEPEPKPFALLVKSFITDLRQERGLSEKTITNYQWQALLFLSWFSLRQRGFADICIEDVDTFLSSQGIRWCRASIATSAKALRVFFRYAEDQRWCNAGIAAAIESPRLFHDETLPADPAWEDLQRIIPQGGSQRDIRDRAILLLFAVYGLCSGEVAQLRLEDINWVLEQISVIRSKQHCSQIYPLNHEVGNAIVRYLREERGQILT